MAEEAAAQRAPAVEPAENGAPVQLALPGMEPLTHQQVVEKLDVVPVFHIVGGTDRMMVPTPTSGGGPACGTWFFAFEDAQRALEATRASNPSLPLAIEASPLGTAFALSEGWSPSLVPEGAHLRLQCSSRVLASMPEPPQPLPEALSNRFNPLTSCLPTFAVDGDFRTPHGATPVCFDVQTLAATWERESGRPPSEMPGVRVVDLRMLLATMLTQAQDWRGVAFTAAPKVLQHARLLNVATGDEPPPLL